MDLINISDLGIDPEPFHILTPNNDTSRCIFIQCSGMVVAEKSVKNSISNLAVEKFINYFKLAKKHNPALVVSPEYSCPWEALLKTLENEENFPDNGSIWALGCESVTIKELESFKGVASTKIRWIFEDVKANGEQIFLSPLAYVFKIKAEKNEPNLCILIQFKGHDMGGTNFERDWLIKGTKRYIIHNPSDKASIKLLGIICAESMVFKHEEQLEPNTPYLLLHIQLNPDPYNNKIINYRNQIFGSSFGEKCEIMIVNWGQKVEIKNFIKCKDFGGSSYLMLSKEFEKEPNSEDQYLDQNHKKGTYLSFSEQHRYSNYLFETQESIIIFDTTKVSQFHSPPQNWSRSGVSTKFVFLGTGNSFEEKNLIDDEVDPIFLSNGGEEMEPSCREKLLAVSVGNLDLKSKYYYLNKDFPKAEQARLKSIVWHKSRNMNSYILGPDECPKGTRFRLSESQKEEVDSCIAKFATLKTLAEDDTFKHYPDVINDYKICTPKVRLNLTEEKGKRIRYNLLKDGQTGNATVAYIGTALPTQAKRKFNELKEILSPQRLVVWYTHNGTIGSESDGFVDITQASDHNELITDE
jgi:hypothetical protein